MKFAIPEISWHNRDPVLSVDFQPKCEVDDPMRLATGGTDSHVLIWYISTTEVGSVNLEVAADLTRHQKAVNVVRWSPNGQYLASGDDESIIFIWKQKTEEPAPVEGEEQYKESWVIHKTLRGHMEDVLDISWSATSLHLASGSVDNKLLVWDVIRGKNSGILSDHKGFVQGVAWDPRGLMIASASSDRVFRTFDIASKKVTSRSSKAVLPFPSTHPLHNTTVRLYHDDTLQTYYRRLQFSPDGLLIAVPAGKIEPEQGKLDLKPVNAVYIYTRPACILPCGEPALVARWSPRLYSPRASGPPPGFACPHRMLLAVGTKRSVLLYDTQQRTPVALISNIHYTRLTDLSWSRDGCTLVASSTDGFCSVIMFADGELGEVLPETDQVAPAATNADEPMEIAEDPQPRAEPNDKETKETHKEKQSTPKIDSFIKFKAPTGKNVKHEKSPRKQKIVKKQQKTPVKMDVLMETAMQSWSDNSNNDIIKPTEKKDERPSDIIEIEDSEDMKLIYEETETQKSFEDTKATEMDCKSDDKDGTEKVSCTDKKDPNCDKESPEKKSGSPKQVATPTAKNSDFLKQAKVTDVREPAKAVPSPKAPRRVSFVTLSSPKNKKKC